MNGRRWLRLGAKALHEIASIGFGGAMAACLVANVALAVCRPRLTVKVR